jgi:hypothetical protein
VAVLADLQVGASCGVLLLLQGVAELQKLASTAMF